METTLIILKPDAVERRLIGRIVARFEEKGLQIAGAKMLRVTRDLAEAHYAEHEGKPYYPTLIQFITSSPVVALAVRGHSAIDVCRRLLGPTDGLEAPGGTIRGDLAMSKTMNLVHASDSPESADRELRLWFREEELFTYDHVDQKWLDASRVDEIAE